jgi:RNA polymerase sigma-70 factor (sigma-E family)
MTASVPVDRSTGWDADTAVEELYAAHYRRLVRLSTLLVRDPETAEEVVQDSFVAMHGRWRTLKEPDQALAYLRQAVVNRSRSVLRHRGVRARYVAPAVPDLPGADEHALAAERRTAVLDAMRALPDRQREVLALRYYLDLSEADIASTLGISRGAVKTHASRGVAALRSRMGDVS